MNKRKTVKTEDASKPLVEKLYTSFFGRAILKILVLPPLSKFAGFLLDKKVSRCLINSFIKNNKIDMTKYVTRQYASFNDFFTREKLQSEINIDNGKNTFISPCDASLTVYYIDENSTFRIKSVDYSVASLLEDEIASKEYLGGLCLVFRLSVDDYHRYCYVDSGTKSNNIHIDGILHTVQPIAVVGEKALVRNSREYTYLYTDNFDKIVQIEVGALLVGRIKNHHGAQSINKGEEKGMFEFGGSTIVLLLKKDVLKLEDEFFL